MKHKFRFSIFLAALVCLLALLLCTGALAASDAPVRYVAAAGAGVDSTVGLQSVGGYHYLFLPASANLRALRLEFSAASATLSGDRQSLTVRSGEPFDLTALFCNAPADGRWQVRAWIGGQTVRFTLMRSSGVASLFVTSPDAAHGRSWVEQDKDNKAKGGGCLLLRADGATVYDGKLKNIKGRGNSTWYMDKRPYQIKLATGADLMETGDAREAAETWVLLADLADRTHLHNRVTLNLADALGMAYSPNCRPVDLWYDGEYRGTYLLSEKTELGVGRVEVEDMEGAIEAANPGTDLEKLETAVGVNACGCRYQYVAGVKLPESLTGGYLLELDFSGRAKEEACWFTTSLGQYVVIKNPEYLSDSAVRAVSERFQAFVDAVVAGDPATLSRLTDLPSLARSYLIAEFTDDPDAFVTSSYFYLPSLHGTLYAGPVWDYDLAYKREPTEFYAALNPLAKALLRIPEFRAAVIEELEALVPLVEDVLLSADADAAAGRLHSLAGYRAELADSYRMDLVLWCHTLYGSWWEQSFARTGLDDELASFAAYLRARLDWLVEATANWGGAAASLPVFEDVGFDAPYYADVAYVTDRGIFAGTDATHFSPNVTLTRAMAVTLLYRLAGTPDFGDETPFPDVTAGRWYAEAVAWAAETGLVRGYDDGTFRPNSPVSRQEFLLLLYRSVGAPTVKTASYLEAARSAGAADWAAEAVAWALRAGVWDGEGSLRPDAGTLRHEAASFLAAYDRVNDSTGGIYAHR